MNTVKRQFGLSLIELMIALAISSLLILGITQVYIDNKRNYVFQQSQAGNLENSRFASLMINEYLGKAGYRRDPVILVEEAFPSRNAGGDCLAFGAGHSITGLGRAWAEVFASATSRRPAVNWIVRGSQRGI